MDISSQELDELIEYVQEYQSSSQSPFTDAQLQFVAAILQMGNTQYDFDIWVKRCIQ